MVSTNNWKLLHFCFTRKRQVIYEVSLKCNWGLQKNKRKGMNKCLE